MTSIVRFGTITALSFLLACSGDSTPEAEQTPEATTTPESKGFNKLDPSALADAVNKA